MVGVAEYAAYGAPGLGSTALEVYLRGHFFFFVTRGFFMGAFLAVFILPLG
jgi:hypothetical protein